MKKIYLAILVCVVGLITSCSDFLDINPRTQISETEFYKTE